MTGESVQVKRLHTLISSFGEQKVELSYKQLERTLAAHFRILPDREGTFRSRIKQVQRDPAFQKLQFPEGAVAKGERARYSGANLFQFVAVFELISTGFPPGLAVAMVADKWWSFACGFGLVINHRRRNKAGKIVYIRVMNSALAELQGRKENAELPGIFVEDEGSLQKILKRNDDRITNSYVVLCASDIVMDVLDLTKRAAQLAEPVLDDEFSDWHLIEGGAAAWWMRAEDGWYLDKLPAGDPPYFIYGDITLLKHEEKGIVAQLKKRIPWEMKFTEEEIETMQGLGLLDERATTRWAPLTDRGNTVWKYIRRDLPEELDDGVHP